MKRITILSILFNLLFSSLHSQIIVLDVSNPFPRVGEECEISYQIKKDSIDINLSNTKSFEEQMKQFQNNNLGEGAFKVTKLITDTGYNTFGPFIFYVNGKAIKSDTISIYFDDPLPKETQGIWVRQFTNKGQEYLIIEQRIAGKWVTTNTSKNSTSMEFKSESDDFIEIDKQEVDNSKIVFEPYYSTTKSQEVQINDNYETVRYKMTVYKIKKKSAFNDTYTLNKRNLKFLPHKENDFEFRVK